MADILSLGAARKRRARAEREALAAANRVKHGRTRAERARDTEADAGVARTLAGARLEGRAEDVAADVDGSAPPPRED